MSVLQVVWFGVQMVYYLHLRSLIKKCTQYLDFEYKPATMMVVVWVLSWGGLWQDSVLLLFESAADVSVALDASILLVVLLMNTAVVIKSPSVRGLMVDNHYHK